jgi:hypothetical protein
MGKGEAPDPFVDWYHRRNNFIDNACRGFQINLEPQGKKPEALVALPVLTYLDKLMVSHAIQIAPRDQSSATANGPRTCDYALRTDCGDYPWIGY